MPLMPVRYMGHDKNIADVRGSPPPEGPRGPGIRQDKTTFIEYTVQYKPTVVKF